MTKRKGPTSPRPWEPLRFSHVSSHPSHADLPGWMRPRIYGNGRYTVTRHEIKDADDPSPAGEPPTLPTMTVLGIHTRTRSTVGAHDWRHFQRIKNELCGPEREGVEIYPAESRLVDTANEYWMWVLPEGDRLHFGFDERDVAGPEAIEPEFGRARQRRLDSTPNLGYAPVREE